MKIINVLTIFIIIFTFICSCREQNSINQIPCTDPFQCIQIAQIGSPCCNTITSSNYKQWVVTNKNPDKTINVEISEETKNGSMWFQTNLFRRTIIPNGTLELDPCPYKTYYNDGPRCELVKRYRKVSACFPDANSDCNSKNILPDNSNLRLTASTISSSGRSSNNSDCYQIEFNILDSFQKKIVSKYYKLISDTTIHNDSSSLQELSRIIFENPQDTLCKTRKTVIISDTLQSYGSECQIRPILPIYLKFINSSEIYNKLWINFPSVISGKIERNGSTPIINFLRQSGMSIWVTVELESSKQYKTDVIKNITFFRDPKSLIISGDFICFEITHIE